LVVYTIVSEMHGHTNIRFVELFKYTVYAMYYTQDLQPGLILCCSIHVKILVYEHKLLKLGKEKKKLCQLT